MGLFCYSTERLEMIRQDRTGWRYRDRVGWWRKWKSAKWRVEKNEKNVLRQRTYNILVTSPMRWVKSPLCMSPFTVVDNIIFFIYLKSLQRNASFFSCKSRMAYPVRSHTTDCFRPLLSSYVAWSQVLMLPYLKKQLFIKSEFLIKSIYYTYRILYPSPVYCNP
jgi:hypothetical protein